MIFNKLIKNEFVKNVFTLLSGSAVSQIIVFLLMPILTRLYSEELFGVYFIFVSTLNILKKITTLRLELTVVLPKKDFWAINALALSIFTTIITSLLFLIISIFTKKVILKIYEISAIGNYIYLLPLTLFFIGIYESFSSWNNRYKEYKKISISKLSYYGTSTASQIAAKFYILTVNGLILGAVFGQMFSTILIFLLSIKNVITHLKDVKIKRIKILLIRYKNIPTFNTLINFITNFSNEIPIYLFTSFYSTIISGLYGIANKIVATPMNMLSQSIGQVFYQKASAQYSNRQDIQPFIKKTILNVLKLGTLPIIAIAAISPFVHFILGEEWKELGQYILILLPSILANFVVQPLTIVPTIVNKQNKFLLLLIIFSAVKILSIWLGLIIFSNPLISLIFLSVSSTIFRIYLSIWIYKSVIKNQV